MRRVNVNKALGFFLCHVFMLLSVAADKTICLFKFCLLVSIEFNLSLFVFSSV